MANQESESLAAYLAHRDVVCPACTYNLRGLSTDRCPECHQQLVLSVALAEPPIVQFVLATIGLATCGAGFATWLLIILAMSLARSRVPPRDDLFLWLFVPLVFVLIDVILVRVFLTERVRRWFRTCPRGRRWAIAAGCWALSALALAAWLIPLAFVI